MSNIIIGLVAFAAGVFYGVISMYVMMKDEEKDDD